MEKFSERFFAALLAGVEETRSQLPQMTRAGEALAEGLLAGGKLFIASVRPDFVSEGFVRSGGLMLLEEYRTDARLSSEDAVIYGWSGTDAEADRALLRQLRASGAHLVGVGPSPLSESAREIFLESAPPRPEDVLEGFGGADYPLVSLQNLVLLWTFTGELVAALTRRGRMPSMYQSVLVPGARQRNERRRGCRFEEEHAVPPIPPGQLGEAYLERLGECFRGLMAKEIEAIEEIARAGERVRQRGRCIHAFLISHFPIYQCGAPGDPRFMQQLVQIQGETPSAAELEERLQPGDLFFFLGYYNRPKAAYEVARQAKALIAEIITGARGSEGPSPDYVIHPQWPFGDALVPVPGYDVEILPASGIVQSAIYWAVVGTMALQRESGVA